MITTHRTQGCSLPGSIHGVHPTHPEQLARFEAELRRPLTPHDFCGITVYHDTAMTVIASMWSTDRVHAIFGVINDVPTMLATAKGWGARLRHLPALDTCAPDAVMVAEPYRQGFETEKVHIVRPR